MNYYDLKHQRNHLKTNFTTNKHTLYTYQKIFRPLNIFTNMKFKSSTLLLLSTLFWSISTMAQNSSIDSLLIVLKNQSDDTNKIKTLNNLGNNLNAIGDGKNAQIYLKEGITISQNIKYDALLAKLHGNLGNAYLYDSKIEDALKSYLESQKIAKKLNLEKENGVSYLGIGSIYVKKGNYPLSLINYNRALSIFRKLNLKPYEDNCLNNIGGIYLEQK